jgi:hypothetical protein
MRSAGRPAARGGPARDAGRTRLSAAGA